MQWISSEIKLKKRHCTRLNPKPYSGAYYISGVNTNNNRKYGDPDSLYVALNYVIDAWECGRLDSCRIASCLCNNVHVDVRAYVMMST